MTPIVWTYIVYLSLSIVLTIWVAKTLHQGGRIFLVDSFHGNEPLADSVNHLLVVGFYLINLGYVCMALKAYEVPVDVQGVFETLSTKMGCVLLILGAMHLFNLYVLSKMRSRAMRRNAFPPIPPDAQVNVINS